MLYSNSLVSLINLLKSLFLTSGVVIVLKWYVLPSLDKLILLFRDVVKKWVNSTNHSESMIRPLPNLIVLSLLTTYSPLDKASLR